MLASLTKIISLTKWSSKILSRQVLMNEDPQTRQSAAQRFCHCRPQNKTLVSKVAGPVNNKPGNLQHRGSVAGGLAKTMSLTEWSSKSSSVAGGIKITNWAIWRTKILQLHALQWVSAAGPVKTRHLETSSTKVCHHIIELQNWSTKITDPAGRPFAVFTVVVFTKMWLFRKWHCDFILVFADRRATARTATFVEPCSIQMTKGPASRPSKEP